MSIVKQTESKMQTSIEHFKNELKSLRSNRANPAILDGIFVEVYGSKMRIKELSSITTSESRQILITPFDPKMLQTISKAIEKDQSLSLRPVIEGQQIRITIPPMDGLMREKLAKQVDVKAEEEKIAIRGIRQNGNESSRKQKADGVITEDEKKRNEKEIQRLTDTYCKEIEALAKAKKQELVTV